MDKERKKKNDLQKKKKKKKSGKEKQNLHEKETLIKRAFITSTLSQTYVKRAISIFVSDKNTKAKEKKKK